MKPRGPHDVTLWTPAEIEKLKRLWLLGKTGRQIAAELGGKFSKSAVIGKARRLKLTHRASPLKQRAGWSAEKIEDFKRLWSEGVSRTDIARYFGIKVHSVDDRRQYYGLPPRTPCKTPGAMRMPEMPPRPKPAVIERPGWPTKAQLMAGR